jgi:hypothetical protein
LFQQNFTESERLRAWRDFRKNFSGSEQELVAAFASTKIAPRFLDYYTPDSWPTVFEIVKEGLLCQSGMTLVIAATMHHLGFIKTQDLALPIISNHITGSEGLVLRYQGQYYNFLPGKIVDQNFVNDHSTIFDCHKITADNLFR